MNEKWLFYFLGARWRNSRRPTNLFGAWEHWKLFLFQNLCAWVVKLVDKLLEHLRVHLKSVLCFSSAPVILRIRLFMAVRNERKFSSLTWVLFGSGSKRVMLGMQRMFGLKICWNMVFLKWLNLLWCKIKKFFNWSYALTIATAAKLMT